MPIMRSNFKLQAASKPAVEGGGNRPRSGVEDRRLNNQESRKSTRASMSNNNITNNRSSITSYGSEVKFKTLFKITQKNDGSPACYKQDGERFDTKETLKLMSSVDYIVKMEICPTMELLYVKFAGIEYSFELVNDPEKDNKSIYQFQWSTHGIDTTLNRHRSDVLCAVKFKNFKEIEFRLQVKFYSPEDIKHASWGLKLGSIMLDCTAGRGTYSSYVEKVKYI